MKSKNLDFLEASGPLQACNGTALPSPLPFYNANSYEIFCCRDIARVFTPSSGGSLILQMSIISNEIQLNLVYEEAAKDSSMQVEY